MPACDISVTSCQIAAPTTLLAYPCGPGMWHGGVPPASEVNQLCAAGAQAARVLDGGSPEAASVDSAAEHSWAPATGEVAAAPAAGDASPNRSSDGSPEVNHQLKTSLSLPTGRHF